MRLRIAVVGAGIGGLAAAIRLAHAGHRVDIYDQRDAVGGKAASRQLGAYRFDTGPSLFTLPWVFRDFFSRVDRRLEDYLSLIPLEPLCRYRWPDGSSLDSSAITDHFAAAAEGLSAGSGQELRAYLDRATRLWRTAGELFLCNSLHEADTYLHKAGLASILRLPGIGIGRSLHHANAQAFTDRRMIQLFDRYATYNGSDPFQTPSTMRIIPHVEYCWGGWAVKDGIISVARALERLALEAGGRIHLGSPVQRILTTGGSRPRVEAIQVENETLGYDLVVSNADVLSTYRRLLELPTAPEARRYSRLEASSSGIVFLWGMKRRFPELLSHNIFFSADYRREFAEIFSGKGAPADPTVYVNITSKTSPADAPSGSENWFVLVNCSANRGQSWPEQVASSRARVLAHLGRSLGCSLEECIEVEDNIDPTGIERETGSSAGSLYGIASNQPLAAFLRHRNRSKRIGGLYFAGGSAHPGGGMPLALLSGGIVADLVEKYEGS